MNRTPFPRSSSGSHALPFAERLLLRLLQGYGALALLALSLVPLRFLPAEDAVILWQYSRTLLPGGPGLRARPTLAGWCL